MTGRTMLGKGARRAALSSVAAVVVLSGASHAQEREDGLEIRGYEAPDTCDETLTQVRITVSGIEATRGILAVDLYGDDPDVFLNKKGRLRRVRVPATEGAVTVCMGVEPGDYAASTYHDENGDRDLQKKWNMMPKEPFGLSGDPELKFGWPKLAPSLFAVPDGGADVGISLLEAD